MKRSPSLRVQADKSRRPAVSKPVRSKSRARSTRPPQSTLRSTTPPETRSAASLFIVGVGASAGGLDALAKFFGSMEPNSGLAYVVVQHLSPDHKSFMVELLSRRTQIPVHRAEDGMSVESNNIYLIPPGKNLIIREGRLRLLKPNHERGVNLPIDVFFRSLAEEQRHRAIGVILSGTGSDGTMGVRAIKDAGGMVMVQSESTAQFVGMPRSAIGTGLADFVLAPEAMPQQLSQYLQHPFVARDQALSREQSSTEALMHKLFRLVRERCGVDFSHYKPATIDRRIERRMSINQLHNLGDYLRVLEESPREAGLLFNEMLICVTRFFRDKAAWEFLGAEVLPKLFERNDGDRSLRVWSPASSTGEEAYSIAMLLADEAVKHGGQWDIKVFATDLSREATETASAGIYPESVVADVPSPLLERHFEHRDEGYQVRDHLRKMVVFARHDLLRDPPFTKLDLAICRNVLIYFQPELQARIISLLHFSLKADGILFLGNSETLGDQADLFQTLSVRHKIYRNRPGSRGRRLQFAIQPITSESIARNQPVTRSHRPIIDLSALEHIYRDVLSDYAAACIVIDEHNEVLHLLGRAGEYLKQPSGSFTNNLLRLTVHNLSSALATALHKAEKDSGEFTYDNVRLRLGNETRVLRIRIKTITLGSRGTVRLVLIEEKRMRQRGRGENYELDRSATQRIADLDQELTYTKESLQATIEELETANEELQATNEELLASNEELQSTNEELQSVNEELHTVNTENLNRIDELAELNNDINNLLAASYVGTMLVDRDLRIRRLSSTSQQLTGLTPDDVNAPLEVLARVMPTPNLVEHAQRVLNDNQPKELEVAARGRFLLVRIAPYRTTTTDARGLVLTIIDITDRKLAEAERIEWERCIQETQKLESLGVLAGGLAHDFNNLLATILGNTALLESLLPSHSDAARKLASIKTAVSHASDLCKQMLAYAGRGPFALRPTDLNHTIMETVELLRVSISERAELKLNLAPGAPIALADATQIRQIIMNLVLNASDALNEKGGWIEIRSGLLHADRKLLKHARPATQIPDGDYAFIEVRDNGCGMKPETLGRILEPFYTTKFIGRGLGLSAVAGIVRRHNGALLIETVHGEGSSFRVLLPRAPANHEAESVPASENWQGHGPVLVIDDEPATGDQVGRMLKSLGFSPLVTRNAREGLSKLSENSSDIRLVLLDLTLAHPDGAQTFHQTLGIHPEVPVLLMSGLNEHDTRQHLRGLRVAGWISKPFTAPSLRQKIQEILSQR